jgi:hypothetical protein
MSKGKKRSSKLQYFGIELLALVGNLDFEIGFGLKEDQA